MIINYNIFLITFILAFTNVFCGIQEDDDYRNAEDRIVLSPAALVDLVWKEQKQAESSSNRGHILTTSNFSESDQDEEDALRNEERLKSRKVWSRWSKWSKCSVTCGEGSIARVRVCVSGRCAPGEREEQQRPCALSPCDKEPDHATPTSDVADDDDLHNHE